MNGVVVVNKPKGITSFGVCSRLRRIFDTKKIGHTGTLDPMAEGVLVVCLGNTSRLIDHIDSFNKRYIAEITFGITTDTLDIWGNELSSSNPDFTYTEFEDALNSHKGLIEQTTPMYSARKVNGRALYSYARNNEEVNVPKKEIVVEDIKILSSDIPHTALLKIECSKGTYIRTICDEIGKSIGCGAVMSSLIRESNDGFDLSEAYTLEELERLYEEGNLNKALLSSDVLVKHLPAVYLRGDFDHSVRNGAPIKSKYALLPDNITQGSLVRLYVNEEFVSLAVFEDERLKPRKVLI